MISQKLRKRQRQKELYKERKEIGLCTKCGEPTEMGNPYCEKCRLAASNRRKARNLQGLCAKCGRPKVEGRTLCERCILRRYASELWGDVERWQELHDLFYIKQQGLCNYFGKFLEIKIGVNAVLDHIISIKNGGSNDISNLQWVHKKINTMKSDMNNKTFLEAICVLSKRIENGQINIGPGSKMPPGLKLRRRQHSRSSGPKYEIVKDTKKNINETNE